MAFGLIETDTKRERTVGLRLQPTEAFKSWHLDRAHTQAVALRVLARYRQRLETHGLIVEQATPNEIMTPTHDRMPEILGLPPV